MCNYKIYPLGENQGLEKFALELLDEYNCDLEKGEKYSKINDFLLINCMHNKMSSFLKYFHDIIECSRAFDFCKEIVFVKSNYDELIKVLEEKGARYISMYGLLKCNFSEYLLSKGRLKEETLEACFSILEYLIFMNTTISGEITKDLSNIIKTMGVSLSSQGVVYLKRAVENSLFNSNLLEATTKELYPSIACDYDVYPETIERAIRDTIHQMYYKLDIKNCHTYLDDNSIPSNKRLISFLYEEVLLLYKIYGYKIEKEINY